MNSTIRVVAILLLAATLVACSNSNQSTTSDLKSENNNTEKASVASFKDGTLTTEEFTLAYKNSEIIKSPSESGYGLYVVYDLQNNSDIPILPQDILINNITIQQTTDTSIVDLEDNYFDLDAFGDDTETYNKQVTLSNALDDQLLPGKTVEIHGTYSLNNIDSPVKFIGLYNAEKVGEFDLSPENNLSSNETNSDSSSSSFMEDLNNLDIEEVSDIHIDSFEDINSDYDDGQGSKTDAVDEAEAFADEFEKEHGRRPSSGEMQMHWLENNNK